MVTDEIHSEIEAIEKDLALYDETNFDKRVEATDTIEFKVIDRIEGLLGAASSTEALIALKEYAERVKSQLEAVDERLFQRLRADIRRGGCTGPALRDLINSYVGLDLNGNRSRTEIGYDNLDVFINGLLFNQTPPVETRAREPEMVYYQQTPARIIFELVEKAQLTHEDVFCDLGSGLGHVPILVNLLSGAKTKGIEFEPAYCEYASGCAADLNLGQVEFINVDAREADYAEGAAFFMYTPFEGKVLQAVLEKLRGESQKRTIQIFTYGPCTPYIARQRWLEGLGSNSADLYTLGVFRSL
jgi:Histone methylation protein DOT1